MIHESENGEFFEKEEMLEDAIVEEPENEIAEPETVIEKYEPEEEEIVSEEIKEEILDDVVGGYEEPVADEIIEEEKDSQEVTVIT